MRKLLIVATLLSVTVSRAQTYTPDWESLDKRPVPDWFSNDKFGIFIHWGMYAVPGYTAKGNYSEWYQQYLQGRKDSAVLKYHKAKFGDRNYYDLAQDFKAELFNPDEWANSLRRVGQNILYLRPNTMMVILYGPVRRQERPGTSPGPRWMWDPSGI